LIWGV